MRSPIRSLSIFAGRFARDRRGATAAIFALAIVPIIGLMGFAIDIGNVIRVQHSLQAATDAAALAGAQDISNNAGDPAGTATIYSSAAGGKNTIPQIAVTTNVTMKCFTSTGASCAGTSSSNGLVVVQSATVPTYFSKIFGISSFPISATSTAGAAGSKPTPLNVMIVLDASGSMNDPDPHCTPLTKLKCALSGVQTLLGILVPSVNQVGLMVFPAMATTSGNVAKATDCNSGSNPTAAAYSASPASRTYQVAAPAKDYRASDTATGLASGSSLVNAVGGGTNCAGGGIQPISGMDTFFADAIWQAQTTLASTGQAGMQNVIVILSDGDSNSNNVLTGSCPANSSVWCTNNNQHANQCRAAIKAADAAAAAGTWVFSIAYNALTTKGSSGTCKYDAPAIDACSTMRQIASDNAKFYSDGTPNACPSSQTSLDNLIAIFKTIGQALQQPRLLANNTT